MTVSREAFHLVKCGQILLGTPQYSKEQERDSFRVRRQLHRNASVLNSFPMLANARKNPGQITMRNRSLRKLGNQHCQDLEGFCRLVLRIQLDRLTNNPLNSYASAFWNLFEGNLVHPA